MNAFSILQFKEKTSRVLVLNRSQRGYIYSKSYMNQSAIQWLNYGDSNSYPMFRYMTLLSRINQGNRDIAKIKLY